MKIISCLFFIFCVCSSTQGEITCGFPNDKHLVSPFNFSWFSTLGMRKSYQCEPGYNATAGYALCTENGWSPKPLCTEVKCTVPQFENAMRLEKVGARLEYQCNPGYKPERFAITCNQQGVWDHTGHCTAIGCEIPYGQHVSTPWYYFGGNRNLGVDKEYWCQSGYKKAAPYATCTEAGWTPNPLCIAPKTGICDPPEGIWGAVLEQNKDKYQDGERVTYECPAYYIKAGDEYLICRNGQWIGTGQCLEPCTVDVYEIDPRKLQLKSGGRTKVYARHGDFITFECQRFFQHDGQIGLRQQCLNGKIELPLCK